MHADSAITTGCNAGGHWRGAADGKRYASGASQTEVPKGRYDNSPGQAERRPGLRTQNDLLFFSFWFGAPPARQTRGKKRGWVGGLFTSGGGLGGLAQGYCLAAPPGAPERRIGSAGGLPLPPPTPPYMRVRVRRFLAVLADAAATLSLPR